MPDVCASRWLLVAVAVMLFSIFHSSLTYAESKVFSGVSTSIILDKSCKEKSVHIELTLMFDAESDDNSSGWFFGKGTSPAEIRRISSMHFEVIHPATRYYNLPPSHMKLKPMKDGFLAVIRDHIPSEKELLESICFFEKVEVNLKPLKEPAGGVKLRAKELFAADLIMLEGENLLFKQKEYRKAEAEGYKALPLYERNNGKLSKEALNASALIAFALMGLERFDEALEIIAPYRKALPEHTDLKELEEILQQLKKNQDDLFRSDPDSKSEIDLEPLA